MTDIIIHPVVDNNISKTMIKPFDGDKSSSHITKASTNFLLHPRSLTDVLDDADDSISIDDSASSSNNDDDNNEGVKNKSSSNKGKSTIIRQAKLSKILSSPAPTPTTNIIDNNKASDNNNNQHHSIFSLLSVKCKNAIQKCLHSLRNIKTLLLEQGIPPPDGIADYDRRVQRGKEFASRFSRNYLYPISRQLDHLDDDRKFTDIYQIVQQSLHAYYNYLPNSTVGNCDKLKIILAHTVHICEIHENYLIRVFDDDDNLNDDFRVLIDALKKHSQVLIEAIEETNTNNNNNKASNNNNINNNKAGIMKMKKTFEKNPTNNMNNQKKSSLKNSLLLKSRLSMYATTSTSFRNNDWNNKKASGVDNLTLKKKFNVVKSRYKTATYKHRPALEKPPVYPHQNNKNIIVLPRNNHQLDNNETMRRRGYSDRLINTPITTPIREDEIVTMIDNERNNHQQHLTWKETLESNNEYNNGTENVLLPPKLVRNNLHVDDDKAITTATLNNSHTNINNNDDEKFVGKIMEIIQQQCAAAAINRNGDNADDVFEEKKAIFLNEILAKLTVVTNNNINNNHWIEPTVTSITGVKNAKLICIKDDNSIIIENEQCSNNINNHKSSNIIDNEVIEKTELTTEQQTTSTAADSSLKIVDKNKIVVPKKKRIKISRLPSKNTLRQLDLLPKQETIRIIQYKLDNHRYCMGNHMYRKTSSIRPWILTGELSDKIFDDALLSVIKEMESEEFLQNLYHSEFQY